MTAFTDYADLRLAVADHVRSDALSDVMDRLTRQAEATFNRRIRNRMQMTSATLTFTAGSAPLPADCLEVIHLYDTAGVPLKAADVLTTLESGTQWGRYAIQAQTVRVYGLTGSRTLLYYAAIPTLTTSATTSNWLLQAAPLVYLYGVGLEAAKHLKDVEMANLTIPLLETALMDLKSSDDRLRWSNGTVRVKGPTP